MDDETIYTVKLTYSEINDICLSLYRTRANAGETERILALSALIRKLYQSRFTENAHVMK